MKSSRKLVGGTLVFLVFSIVGICVLAPSTDIIPWRPLDEAAPVTSEVP